MLRQGLWLVFDLVVGLLLAGVAAPLTIPQLPERFRSSAAVWGLALLCVVLIALVRRLLRISAVNRPR